MGDAPWFGNQLGHTCAYAQVASGYHILDSEITEHFRYCRKLYGVALVWNPGLAPKVVWRLGGFINVLSLQTITTEE